MEQTFNSIFYPSKEEPWDHWAANVDRRHWALLLVKSPLKFKKMGALSLNDFCRHHADDKYAISCAAENVKRKKAFVQLATMGDDARQIQENMFPLDLALKTGTVYPFWANIKVLSGYLIQTELDTYSLNHKRALGDWLPSNVKDGTFTTTILEAGNFDRGIGLSHSNAKGESHEGKGQRLTLGLAYQLLKDSEVFHSNWDFTTKLNEKGVFWESSIPWTPARSKQDLKAAFKIRKFEGLSIRPSHLIGISKQRHYIKTRLTNTPVTPFEIDIVLIYLYAKYVNTTDRENQIKSYNKYLLEHGETEYTVDPDPRFDPFLALKDLYRKRVPLLPWFLESYVPQLW